LINASGPWIDSVRRAGNIDSRKIIFPTKGIHLVLPKLSEQALFVTSKDGRMFFIIPFDRWSLIGTTDTKYEESLDDVHASRDDVDYLITESRRVLPGLNITREAILYTYAGIRPLAFSGTSESKISRKHRVIKEGRTRRIITIAGGKLTTYRNMAKDTVDAACRMLGRHAPCVTDQRPFPGGLHREYEDYLKEALPDMAARHKIGEETVRHLIRFYGSGTERVLDIVDRDRALGQAISPESRDIYAQVVYSVVEEGARTLSDIILRRMHLGMTGTRGKDQAGQVASIAAQELKWSEEEKGRQIESFHKDLGKDNECLK
jgi:glycerol-3-phosphate dehydrogenase